MFLFLFFFFFYIYYGVCLPNARVGRHGFWRILFKKKKNLLILSDINLSFADIYLKKKKIFIKLPLPLVLENYFRRGTKNKKIISTLRLQYRKRRVQEWISLYGENIIYSGNAFFSCRRLFRTELHTGKKTYFFI